MVWLFLLFLAALFIFAVIQCARHRRFGLLLIIVGIALIIVGLAACIFFSALPSILAPSLLPHPKLNSEGLTLYQEYVQLCTLPRYISLGVAVLGVPLSVLGFFRNRKKR